MVRARRAWTTRSVAAAGRSAAGRLDAEPGVEVLGSYWTAPGPAAAGLRSADGSKALVVAHVEGDEDAVMQRAADLESAYTTSDSVARIQTGGFGQANLDITGQVTTDLARAEAIAVPLTLILLIVAFGSVVSGLLPLLVGGIAIAATFAALSLIAEATSVSIFALNLTTALGLGLGIDYSLLVVSRYREELAAGRDVRSAVAVTMATAGRTVVFSAATIAVALAALLVFPLYFLRSFAYAGMAVVSIAALASVVTLPALLTVLGPRVDALRLRRRARRPAGAGAVHVTRRGFWNTLARFVMRRPVLAAAPVIAILLALGAPFLGVRFAVPDDRVIPAEVSQARQVGDVMREDFAGAGGGALFAVLPQATPASVNGYAARLEALPGVARVEVQGAVVRAAPSVDLYGAQAEELVRASRAIAVDGAGPVLVGGPSAELVDVKASIADRLPLAAGLIGLTTFGLLFLFTGSVVLPLKALVVNAFTIVGVLGTMVWVFQDGHLGRPARVHPDAVEHHHAAADVLCGVRPVDGLRGLPARPDQGVPRCRGGHHDRGRRGARAHGPDRHHRGRPAGDHHVRLRLQPGQLHPDVRAGNRAGDRARRDPGPRCAGAGADAPDGPVQLVGPRAPAPPAHPDRPLRASRPSPSPRPRPRPKPRVISVCHGFRPTWAGGSHDRRRSWASG